MTLTVCVRKDIEVGDALRATLQGSFAGNNFAVHLQK